MKAFIRDLVSFDTKYHHIPLIMFCVLYLFSPIDFLPEIPIKRWYSYIDDILILIATGVIVYIDKGGILCVKKSGRIKKSGDNTIVGSNSTSINNTPSVKVNSSVDSTTCIDSDTDKYDISGNELSENCNEQSNTEVADSSNTATISTSSNTNATECRDNPKDSNDYITELKQKSRGELVVETKNKLW